MFVCVRVKFSEHVHKYTKHSHEAFVQSCHRYACVMPHDEAITETCATFHNMNPSFLCKHSREPFFEVASTKISQAHDTRGSNNVEPAQEPLAIHFKRVRLKIYTNTTCIAKIRYKIRYKIL